MTALSFHPLAELFPLIEGKEFDELVADIKTNGLREPIVLDKPVLSAGQIIDGRNRFRACEASGTAPRFEIAPAGTDLIAYVISKNLHRRHLDQSQRAMIAARLATMRQGQRTDLSPIGERSQADAADTLNVGKRSVERAAEVIEHGTVELQGAVDKGDIAVSTAAEIASLPGAEQTRVLALGDDAIIQKAKEIRARKAADKRAKAVEARAANAVPGGKVSDLRDLAASGFKAGVIMADPPWRFRTWTETNDAKSARAHYDLMDTEKICALPVLACAADDCALFIWATWPTIFQTQAVIEAWGFRYSGLAWEWFKANPITEKAAFGLGYGTRKNLEPCLLAIRGKPALISHSERDWLVAPRREHSKKPDEQYERIEAMYGGPNLELFGRRERSNWIVWGNEVEFPDFDPDTGEITTPHADDTTAASASGGHASGGSPPIALPLADVGSARPEREPEVSHEERPGVGTPVADGGVPPAVVDVEVQSRETLPLKHGLEVRSQEPGQTIAPAPDRLPKTGRFEDPDDDLTPSDFLQRVDLTKPEIFMLNRIRLEDCDSEERAVVASIRRDHTSATISSRKQMRAIAESQGLLSEQGL